ncbi:MAG: hypothetical protein AB9869_12725 [Verrucomicrobiia bacterium]
MKLTFLLSIVLAGCIARTYAEAPVEIPASFAWPLNSANQNAPGFKVRVAQADPGEVGFFTLPASSARAEAQLDGALVNPATRQPYSDVADKTQFNPDGTYDEAAVIDYEETGNATALVPGIPDDAASKDSYALEAVTFLELQPGTYTMIVNSDDGFRVSAGRDARDWFDRITVGEAEGPRGAADTTFTFTVSQAGLYSFRLLWYEGGGGGNVSWFSDENRALVNDTGSGGVKAYRAISQSRPTYIRYASPAQGAVGVPRAPEVQFQIVDGDAVQVDPGSIGLFLNDVGVTPVVQKTGSITKVSYTPSGLLSALSTNKVRLVYRDTAQPPAERTEEITFRATEFASIYLPEPIYFENFDSTPEGSLPPGWSEISHTDQSGSSPEIDFGNLDSAAYAKWTVVNVDRFQGEFVTYSNPDNPASWEQDYQRVLSFNAANIVNDQVVTNLATGRFLFGNSGYRNGMGQILYAFTPDFNLAGKSDVHLSFHSLWEQNQDSFAAVEYSIDSGQTWLPIIYMMNNGDIVRDGEGQIDAVATLTTEDNEAAQYVHPETGETLGRTYGTFIAAEINPDLAPFISGRTDDDAVGSKRVELFRLERADNQPKVRFRFAHAGADSWYFGIDNFGLYSIGESTSSSIQAVRNGSRITLTWTGGAGIVLQEAAAVSGSSWEDVAGTSGASSHTDTIRGTAAFYRLFKR